MKRNGVLGRNPETFTVAEAISLAGKWAAFEVYTPETTPVHLIQALGDTPEECMRQLAERGVDPRNYELMRLKAPF